MEELSYESRVPTTWYRLTSGSAWTPAQASVHLPAERQLLPGMQSAARSTSPSSWGRKTWQPMRDEKTWVGPASSR